MSYSKVDFENFLAKLLKHLTDSDQVCIQGGFGFFENQYGHYSKRYPKKGVITKRYGKKSDTPSKKTRYALDPDLLSLDDIRLNDDFDVLSTMRNYFLNYE